MESKTRATNLQNAAEQQSPTCVNKDIPVFFTGFTIYIKKLERFSKIAVLTIFKLTAYVSASYMVWETPPQRGAFQTTHAHVLNNKLFIFTFVLYSY